MANRITTIFDFSERGQGLKKIKADMAEVDGSINKAKTGVKGLWAEFSGNRAAQAAVAGLAIKIGKDAVQAASNLEESINAVNVAYGAQADEIHRLGEQSSETWGLSQRAFNEFAVQFSAFASQIANRDGRAVSDVVSEMTTRVADFASVMNLDVSEAARVFQSALSGEQEPIKRFGINLSAAAVEAHALEKGMAASKSEIDENVKVQARYSLLMQETAKVSGDFKNTQDGLANSSRTLTAQFEDLQAKLGEQLLPVVSDTVAEMVDLASVIGQVITAIENAGDRVPGPVKSIADAAYDLSLPVMMLEKPLDALAWGLDKVGLSSEESAFSIDKAKKAYYANKYAAGQYQDATEDATEATEEATERTDDYTKAQELVAQSIRHAVYEVEHSNAALDKARAFAERAAEYVRNLGSQWDRLKDKLNDRSAFLDVEDSFDALEDSIAAAEAAQKEFGEESREAEQALRDQERATMDLKNKVIDYGNEVADLPDQVLTNILSLIDQGKLAEAEAALERLERARTINYIPVVQAPRTSGGQRFMASGGISPGGPTVVGERGPELVDMPRGARVRSAVETVTDTRSTGRGGNTSSGVTVVFQAGSIVAGMGADGADIGRKIVEEIRKFERFNGNGWRAS